MNRKTSETSKEYHKFLVFSLNHLELTATQKTFTVEATVRLGAVNLQHHRVGHKTLAMIETPDIKKIEEVAEKIDIDSQYLFAITYNNVSASYFC